MQSKEGECYVSVVIPLHNEVDNLQPLLAALEAALAAAPFYWEVILVDDGSLDGTLALALAMAANAPHVRVVALQRNYGQTAAMQAGIEHAYGRIIVTLDGDLQNDPADIMRMVAELQARQLDLLVGWRQQREDHKWLRIWPSRLANRLIGSLTGIRLHDYGCSLKAYRAAVIRQVRLYGEMHRFIPLWVACQVPRQRIGELVVRHHPRQRGRSNYGLGRSYRVLLDLLVAAFFLKFRARPGHFFGAIGLALAGVGSVMLGWLGFSKFILGEEIGGRPMLLVAVLLVLAALQLLTTGVLAELLSRIYFTAPGNASFSARELRSGDDAHAAHEPPPGVWAGGCGASPEQQ